MLSAARIAANEPIGQPSRGLGRRHGRGVASRAFTSRSTGRCPLRRTPRCRWCHPAWPGAKWTPPFVHLKALCGPATRASRSWPWCYRKKI